MASSPPDDRSQRDGLPIYVCVPTTRQDIVGATIKAIRRQTWSDWELIVVGQGAHEAIQAAVFEAADGDARVRYVPLPGRGLSMARNAGMANAAGAVVAFTDDDCEPQPEWLSSIAHAFVSDCRIGVVGGAVLTPTTLGPLVTCPTVSPAEAVYDPATNPRRPPDGWDWIGANFAIRRPVATELGQFDECLGAGADFPAAEDTDYKLRLEAAGVRMLSTPKAAVVHTYGVRRGLSAVLNSQRNYATGNGGMAAKLTLQGDSRGEAWLAATRVECLRELRGAPHRGVRGLRRLHYFSAAYKQCLREFRVVGGLLNRI